MPVFLPPRCEDCGAKPGEQHLSWCPYGPGPHKPEKRDGREWNEVPG